MGSWTVIMYCGDLESSVSNKLFSATDFYEVEKTVSSLQPLINLIRTTFHLTCE